jgi:hypothetical protein
MKKFLIPALVLVLLLASFTPALAGNGIRLKGNITAIDEDAQTFTLRITSGSDYVGESITVQVAHSTKLYECDGEGDKTVIYFEVLEVGDRVGVTGTFAGDVFIAKKVVVH